MKKFLPLVLSVGVAFHIGCTTKKPEITITDEPKVSQIGQKVSMTLLKRLKGELLKSLQKPPYEAIDVCHEKALKITKQVEEEFDHGIKVKRTSLKYRNPKNKPDEIDKQILTYLEKLNKQGKLPQELVVKVNEGGKSYYRYYKPLKIKPLCLMCHGDPKLMDKKLLAKIKKYYPNDRAVGYKVGDLRGVVEVQIPANIVK